MRQGASRAQAIEWAAGLAGPVPATLPALRREWNRAKAEVAPWWAANSKEAYNSGLDGFARALKGFFDSRRGARRGSRVGWPRRKKHGGRRSFRVTTGSFGVIDDRHIRLPRIGVIRTKEPTVKLLAQMGAGRVRILSATVSEQAGRWQVSFTCESNRPPARAPDGPVVGVDLGVTHLAVLSSSEQVANPKHLSKWQRRQARLQVELSRRSGPAKGRAPSKRWLHTKARLAHTHRRVADARVDSLHKLTTRLAKTHAVVVVEDLAVGSMTAAGSGSRRKAKAGLNRAILDTAPRKLRRQLAYKTAWYGSRLVVADRWYPSTKTCSTCKTVKANLSLGERTFTCDACGLVMDRDFNAALNLASLVEAAETGTASGAGTSQTTGLANAQEETSHPIAARGISTNCEDSTSRSGPDQTATAAEQSTAA
jgi:putative transposase